MPSPSEIIAGIRERAARRSAVSDFEPTDPHPELLSAAQMAGERHGIDPDLLLSIADVESSGGRKLVGELITSGMHKGDRARGPFQFTTKTWGDYGQGADINDFHANTDAAARMLADNFKRYGSVEQAVMRHHGRPELSREYWAKVKSAFEKRKSMAPTLSEVAPQGETAPAEPVAPPSMGDYAREFGAGAATAFDMAVQAPAQAIAEGLNRLGIGDGRLEARGPFGALGTQEALRGGMTAGGKRALADSVQGNLFDPETWKAGAEGSVRMLAASGLGQGLASMAMMLATRSVAGSAAMGANQVAGARIDEARQEIYGTPDAALIKESPKYAELRKTMNEGEAKQELSSIVGWAAAAMASPTGALEGAFVGKLLPGAGTALKRPVNLLSVQGAGKVGLAGTGEAAQEVTESALGRTAMNLIAGTDRDPFANSLPEAVGGFLPGAGFGAAKVKMDQYHSSQQEALAKEEQQRQEAEARAAQEAEQAAAEQAAAEQEAQFNAMAQAEVARMNAVDQERAMNAAAQEDFAAQAEAASAEAMARQQAGQVQQTPMVGGGAGAVDGSALVRQVFPDLPEPVAPVRPTKADGSAYADKSKVQVMREWQKAQKSWEQEHAAWQEAQTANVAKRKELTGMTMQQLRELPGEVAARYGIDAVTKLYEGATAFIDANSQQAPTPVNPAGVQGMAQQPAVQPQPQATKAQAAKATSKKRSAKPTTATTPDVNFEAELDTLLNDELSSLMGSQRRKQEKGAVARMRINPADKASITKGKYALRGLLSLWTGDATTSQAVKARSAALNELFDDATMYDKAAAAISKLAEASAKSLALLNNMGRTGLGINTRNNPSTTQNEKLEAVREANTETIEALDTLHSLLGPEVVAAIQSLSKASGTAETKRAQAMSRLVAAIKDGQITKAAPVGNLLSTSRRNIRFESKEESVTKNTGSASKLQEIAEGKHKTRKNDTSPRAPIENILMYVEDNSATAYERTLARALRKWFEENNRPFPTLEFAKEQTGSYAGMYFPKGNKLVVYPAGRNVDTVLHEVLHAVADTALKLAEVTPDKVSAEVIAAVAELDAILAEVAKSTDPALKYIRDNMGKDAWSGRHELIAQAMTYRDVQEALKKIKFKSTANRNTLWSAFKGFVRKLLSLQGVSDTALNAVMEASATIIGENVAGKTAPSRSKKGLGSPLSAKQNADGTVDLDFTAYADHQRVPEAVARMHLPLAEQTAAKISSFADKLREKAPDFMGWISNFADRVNLSNNTAAILGDFDTHRQAVQRYANDIFHTQLTADQQVALMKYLDGDTTAIENLPEKQQYIIEESGRVYKRMRDEAVRNGTIPRYLANAKPSELIIWVQSSKDLVGAGIGTLGGKRGSPFALAGTKSITKPLSDLHHDGNEPNEAYHPIIRPGLASEEPYIDGFVSHSRFLKDATPGVDPLQNYYIKSTKGENVTLERNLTVTEARALHKHIEAQQALANTMDVLAKVNALHQMTNALNEIGTAEGSVLDADSAKGAQLAKVGAVIDGGSAEIRRAPLNNAVRRPNRWVKVPSEGYGPLSGKLIHGPIWAAIQDMNNPRPVINSGTWGTIIRGFKAAKTRWSPGTHLTNAVSNLTLMYFHDIPFSALQDATLLLRKEAKNPKALTQTERAMLQKFYDSGAVIGNFSTSELRQQLHDAIITSMEGEESFWGTVKSLTKLELGKSKMLAKLGAGAEKLNNFTSGLYEAEDNVFRLASFMHTVANATRDGKTPTEADFSRAGRLAREQFLDYNIHARYINVAKQTALPFISWPYRYFPMLAKVMVQKPYKLPLLLGAMYVLEGIFSAIAEGSDADDERKRAATPGGDARMFGFGPHKFWSLSENGLLDVGRFLPGSDLFHQDSSGGFMGAGWWPSQLTPNGPLMSLFAMVAHVDPFTGKKLEENATGSSFKNHAKYLWNSMAPTPLNTKVVDEIATGFDSKGYAGEEVDNAMKFTRMLGSPFIEVTPEAQANAAGRKIKEAQKKANAIKFDANKQLRMNTIDEAQYEAAMTRYAEIMAEMHEDIQKLLEE